MRLPRRRPGRRDFRRPPVRRSGGCRRLGDLSHSDRRLSAQGLERRHGSGVRAGVRRARAGHRGHRQSRVSVSHRHRPFVHAAAQPDIHAGDRTGFGSGRDSLRGDGQHRQDVFGRAGAWRLREPTRATCWMRARFPIGAASRPSRRRRGVSFETRSGNLDRPQQNWSPWEKLNSGRIASPAARFLQYKATLTGLGRNRRGGNVAYQMKNVAPVIEEVEITPANYKFPAPSAAPVTSNSLNNPASLTSASARAKSSGSSATASAGSANTPALSWAKGYIGARWLASDDNGDTLIYTVEIRGVNETAWKLLRDKIRENYLSWDSTAFPDGKYVVRITASDSPSNPPDQALSSSRETRPVPDRQHSAGDHRLEWNGGTWNSGRRQDRDSLPRQGRAEHAGQGRVFDQRRRLDGGGADHAPDRFNRSTIIE